MQIKLSNDLDFLIQKTWEDKSLSKDLNIHDFRKYITRYFHLFPPKCFLLENDGKYLGCSILNENVFGYEMISYITIEESNRGKGLSKYLLDFILEDKSKNYCLYCEEKLISFWKKFDFYETGFIKNDLTLYHFLVIENNISLYKGYERFPVI